jgi:hypothetical protein
VVEYFPEIEQLKATCDICERERTENCFFENDIPKAKERLEYWGWVFDDDDNSCACVICNKQFNIKQTKRENQEYRRMKGM